MPSQPIEPFKTPVKLSFPDGTELTSLFDPATNLDSVHCDLCGALNQLRPQGAGNSIYQHRGSEGCKIRVFKQEKEAARECLKVSYLISQLNGLKP